MNAWEPTIMAIEWWDMAGTGDLGLRGLRRVLVKSQTAQLWDGFHGFSGWYADLACFVYCSSSTFFDAGLIIYMFLNKCRCMPIYDIISTDSHYDIHLYDMYVHICSSYVKEHNEMILVAPQAVVPGFSPRHRPVAGRISTPFITRFFYSLLSLDRWTITSIGPTW